jgi:hypothetical protein
MRLGSITIPLALLFPFSLSAPAQQLPREQWGAPAVTVSEAAGKWTIAGKRNKLTLSPSDLALKVDAGPLTWAMAPSSKDDMLVKSKGRELHVRLADAGKIDVVPYDTGYKTGVKISLSRFRHAGAELDLALYLTVCLEGRDEELVFDVATKEGEAVVRQLDWPKELDARSVDFTVLSNRRGTLLPRNWPKEYNPVRATTAAGTIDPKDTSVIQSNLIECWSMSWWGFQKGPSAMMVIVETPEDASYKFHHPAGGPTVIGPRWSTTLGRFGYPRSARMVFFEKGNYVDLAKRYRRHVIDSGQFVSLKEKMAREPAVAQLIGTPHLRQHLLRNYRPGSHRYDPKDSTKNYNLVTFDQRANELRQLKAKGIDRLYVCLAGWPRLGYDRQHPDELPPASEAGGWEGMRRYAEVAKELGYLFVLHDQYRDYYTDAPSYQSQFAVHEEDAVTPPVSFPGSRFGQWKEGQIPFMDYWDGGKQTSLDPRFMLGHLVKNYRLMFEHGIKPRGAYLDVFGYVPPDQDFNPEHPATRADSMKFRAACFRWVRANLGLVGTEAAADWVIPHVDFGSANPGRGQAVPVPLYELVYHDAIVLPYGGRGDENLVGLLCGGVPQIGQADKLTDEGLRALRRMAALHARVGLSEMTNHEFLDANRRQERTTFADGTVVTVDWDARTVRITPELKE